MQKASLFGRMLSLALLGVVWMYKKTLSPQTGVLRLLYYSPLITLQPGHTGCRFNTTCSTYAQDILRSHPPHKALQEITRRVTSCHA